jgi:hypothetical protein
MGVKNDNILFVILAIIGGIVVLGFLLKVAFKLIGVVIVIGLAVAGYMLLQKMVGKGR